MSQPWSDDIAANRQRAEHCLQALADACTDSLPVAQLEPHLAAIHELCDGKDIYQVLDAIERLQTDDRWLLRAKDGAARGSPLALLWTDRQLQETRSASLREVFLSELVLATNILRYPEFTEGVRALLIDKDRQPRWQHSSVGQVPVSLVDTFFKPPWPVNPLADLPAN